jgi:hypothetical protein
VPERSRHEDKDKQRLTTAAACRPAVQPSARTYVFPSDTTDTRPCECEGYQWRDPLRTIAAPPYDAGDEEASETKRWDRVALGVLSVVMLCGLAALFV